MDGATATDVGRMQLYFGIANDIGVYFVTLGNGGAYLDAINSPGFCSFSAIGANYYTIYDYYHARQEYKKNENKNKK